ncbi:hypothetical protein C491_03315 [Natronococcus amylolyticus DSM 10524]|uniref:Uncharacterized protein n=1 Tax=Natronococcus amylolyticus DSM 10524 TaxID=1227497 RepID=L9XFT7_9EURY|nr:hypothetical protein C491_03315 [Natronococcus amylolyticus DSM 10524]
MKNDAFDGYSRLPGTNWQPQGEATPSVGPVSVTVTIGRPQTGQSGSVPEDVESAASRVIAHPS